MSRLLLIHGFGCDHRFWEPQLPALAAHHVTVPDLPCHGGPTLGVEHSLQGLAAWLAEEHLRHPAVLVGHSLGGMIALQLAQWHPERVQGLALIDSFASLELNASFLPGLYCDATDGALRAWIDAARAEIIGRMTQATYDEIWPSVAAFDARPWLTQIACPLLGVYGGRGRYAADESARLRRDLCLDGVAGPVEVRVVPGAAHFVNLERADEVNRALVGWLECWSPASSHAGPCSR